MSNDSKFRVHSDIAHIRSIVVHQPDAGIEWVTPTNKDFLLYDDIVYLPRMQEEHEIFNGILKAFAGEDNVLDLEDLLADVLQDAGKATELLKGVQALENLSDTSVTLLLQLDPAALSNALFAGYRHGDKNVLEPVPNLIFTRDIAAMVEDHLLICHASKLPRKRENLMTWFVFHYHPMFASLLQNDRYLDISGSFDVLVKNLLSNEFTIEGGDITYLGNKNLLIACSERTNMAGIERIRDIGFEKGIIDRLTVVDIPKEAYCMHIDTIFSQINTHDYVVFDKILLNKKFVNVFQFQKGKTEPVHFENLAEMLRAEDPKARFIHCGGGMSPFDEREQWTMACNTVAVKPGVVVTYGRNTRTLKAFEECGYKIVKAKALLAAYEAGVKTPEETVNTIITIPAGELSRGGGGPHCLTLPIGRRD